MRTFPVILLRRAVAALSVAAAPLAALAVTIENPLGEGATFSTVINSIVRYANSLLAPLSALMVLIAGFLYMTGGGSPERLKAAHKTMIWALVGIGIVLLANSTSLIVKQLLGVR